MATSKQLVAFCMAVMCSSLAVGQHHQILAGQQRAVLFTPPHLAHAFPSSASTGTTSGLFTTAGANQITAFPTIPTHPSFVPVTAQTHQLRQEQQGSSATQTTAGALPTIQPTFQTTFGSTQLPAAAPTAASGPVATNVQQSVAGPSYTFRGPNGQLVTLDLSRHQSGFQTILRPDQRVGQASAQVSPAATSQLSPVGQVQQQQQLSTLPSQQIFPASTFSSNGQPGFVLVPNSFGFAGQGFPGAVNLLPAQSAGLQQGASPVGLQAQQFQLLNQGAGRGGLITPLSVVGQTNPVLGLPFFPFGGRGALPQQSFGLQDGNPIGAASAPSGTSTAPGAPGAEAEAEEAELAEAEEAGEAQEGQQGAGEQTGAASAPVQQAVHPTFNVQDVHQVHRFLLSG